MALTFDEAVTADLASVFDPESGPARSAVYRPKAGGEINLAVFFSHGEHLADDAFEFAAAATGQIWIRKADVADPDVYDEIDIDGYTWRVDRIAGGDSFIWVLDISRDIRMTLRG